MSPVGFFGFPFLPLVILIAIILALTSCAVDVGGPPGREVTYYEAGAGGDVIYVNEAPPAPRQEEIVGAAPGSDYVWVGGYWARTPSGWTWVSGRWVSRPRPGVVWVPGHWQRHPRGHVWVSGHWR